MQKPSQAWKNCCLCLFHWNTPCRHMAPQVRARQRCQQQELPLATVPTLAHSPNRTAKQTSTSLAFFPPSSGFFRVSLSREHQTAVCFTGDWSPSRQQYITPPGTDLQIREESYFHCDRSCQTILHRNCTSLFSHSRWMSVCFLCLSDKETSPM